MPRDGSQEYHAPFPDVVEGTTIESTVYNGFVNDVVLDLNLPRPIKYGGTGADNAADALTNIGAEKANQIVTNYDSHLWIAGSFSATSSATSPPVAAHAFSGIVYLSDSSNIVVEARDSTDGKLYIRRKTAGTWGAWTLDGDLSSVNAAIALKVAKAGDTMTGALELPAAAPTLGVHATNKTYVDTADAAITAALFVTYGQCRLMLSAGSLKLSPVDGNRITINGVNCTIPDAGVTLAATGLTVGTTYYIYAVATAGAVSSLEASATGHSPSTTAGNKGVEIKTGDNTRSLVGMARVITGPAWVDNFVQRFVTSWFNRRARTLMQIRVDTGAVIGTGFVERTTSNRCEFLTWADEDVGASAMVAIRSSAAGTTCNNGIGFDAVSPPTILGIDLTTAGAFVTGNCQQMASGLTEGYHFSSYWGSVAAGNGTAQVTNMATVRG